MKSSNPIFHLISVLLIFPALAGNLFSKPLMITTTADLASIARAVAGETLTVKSLSSGKDDLHSIEARPSFAVLLSRADVLFVNGAELDLFIGPALESSRNAKIQKGNGAHLDASRWVELRDVSAGGLDRMLGDVHASGNPHYLLNPENGLRVAVRLARELAKLFPAQKEMFQTNFEIFSNQLWRSMEHWRQMASPLRGQGFISYHSDWKYFADFLGMREVMSLEPKPGIPPTPSQLLKVVEAIQAGKIRHLIQATYNENRPGEWVAAKTGIKVSRLASQTGALPEVKNYLDIFEVNLRILLASSD